MFILKVLPFLFLVSVTKSSSDFQTMCKNNFNFMDKTRMNVKYCLNKLCLVKCCRQGEFLNLRGHCMTEKFFFKIRHDLSYLRPQINYTNIDVYALDGYGVKKSKKKSKDIDFIQNIRNNVFNCTVPHDIRNTFYILEDGSLKMLDTTGSKSWSFMNKLEYCVDFGIFNISNSYSIKLAFREDYGLEADVEEKTLFVTIACSISSFFLLLTFIVYCLLPGLQNLNGLVLMTYIMSIFITFVIKIVLNLLNKSLTVNICKVISPMLYFAAVSSFFWTSIMSFDTWWSLRGFRKKIEINRRGKIVKFMWYSLCGWGSPLLMTAIVTTLDNIDLSDLPFISKPPFDDCFSNEKGVKYYFIIPIMIILAVNTVLFILTVYNILMIKGAISKNKDSRNNQKQTNRFTMYVSISVIMGISWILELISSNVSLTVYILVNTYNLLTGVSIFFLFVCKRRILNMLLKRLNIQNEYINNWVSQRTKSATTRSTRVSTVKDNTKNSKNTEMEIDILKNSPKEIPQPWILKHELSK